VLIEVTNVGVGRVERFRRPLSRDPLATSAGPALARDAAYTSYCNARGGPLAQAFEFG
jgi:hypothetical protein